MARFSILLFTLLALASLFTPGTGDKISSHLFRLPVPKTFHNMKRPPVLPGSMYDSISCYSWASRGTDAHWKKVLTIAYNLCDMLDEEHRNVSRPVIEIGRNWDFYGDISSIVGSDVNDPHEGYHAGIKEHALFDGSCEPEKETLDLLRPKGLDLEDYADSIMDSLTHSPYHKDDPSADTRVCVSLLYNAWAMCDNKVGPSPISLSYSLSLSLPV